MKLELLQCLRGVAALMVVLFHFSSFLEPVVPGSAALLSGGYLGVDIFFVLSGFIIFVSTDSPRAREGGVFLTRRFCRVVLPAWVAMFLSVLVMPPHLADLIKGMLFIPLSNSAPPGFGYSFLIVAWTLTYELIFYGLFALVLFFGVGKENRGGFVIALLLLLVFAIQALAGGMTLDAQNGPIVGPRTGWLPFQIISLLGNPILLEFAVGVALGMAYLKGYFHRMPLFWSSIICFGLGILILVYQFRPGHGLNCGGLFTTLLVVYTMLLQARIPLGPGAPLVPRPWQKVLALAVFTGDISYSLYLVHPTVKALLIKIKLMALWQPATFVIAMVITFVVSVLFYKWVEMPAQKLGRRLSARRALLPTTESALASSGS